MPRNIGFGILGCADIARRKMLPALVLEPGAELVAVASRSTQRARATAAVFGCEAVTGYDALLDRDDVDAVYVPLPAGLHARWIRAALLAGKHVLVEKPAVLRLSDAVELVRLAGSRGLLLMEGFMFLRHSLHAAVTDLVQTGVIGRVQALTSDFGMPPRPAGDIRSDPDLGGGALNDVGVHPLRLSRHLLGDDLEVVGACSVVDPELGVDVSGSALLRNRDGVTAQLTYGFRHAYRSTYALWGDAGRLEVPVAFTPPPHRQPVLRIEQQGLVQERTLPADDQFRNLVRAFTRAADDELERAAQGRDIMRQAALLEAVHRAAGTPHRQG